MPAVYLETLASDLLDAALDALAQARTGHAPPSRTYIAHGAPAVDGCDTPGFTGQLTVHMIPARAIYNRASPDAPQVPRTRLLVPIAVFALQLWRCYPALNENPIPTATQIDAASSGLLVDAWCLYTGITAEHFAGTLFTGIACEDVTFGDAGQRSPNLAALEPKGGMAGWEMRVSVALNDGGP